MDDGVAGAEEDPVADGGPESAGFAELAGNAGVEFSGCGPDEEAAMVGGGYAAGNAVGGGELGLEEAGPADGFECAGGGVSRVGVSLAGGVAV